MQHLHVSAGIYRRIVAVIGDWSLSVK